MSDRCERRKARVRRHSKPEPICINCGKRGSHSIPPAFGDPGFFVCERRGGFAVGDQFTVTGAPGLEGVYTVTKRLND